MATTNKRKPRRKPRTLKQIAKKVMRSAEDQAQRLIHGVEKLQKRARKKPVRAARARRGGARAHAS